MKKAPLIYVDHGSPMRILEDNPINDRLSFIWKSLEKTDIKSILIISAHWITRWTHITTNSDLETIHDFYGFPDSQIPVVQLSIDSTLSWKDYFEIWKKLSILREKGVLIIWSWSIVHNLRDFVWDENIIFPWAKDFDEKIKKSVLENDFKTIVNYESIENYKKSVPSFDHFVPLLYILWAVQEEEKLEYFYENISNWSLTNNIIITK